MLSRALTAQLRSLLSSLLISIQTMIQWVFFVCFFFYFLVAYRRDDIWSDGRYEYDRLPRERLPPRSHPEDDYLRVVNIISKKPPLLDKPGEGGYNRYDYNLVDYQEYDEGRSFSHDRRSGTPHRGDEPSYRWTRDDHPISRQPDYRGCGTGTKALKVERLILERVWSWQQIMSATYGTILQNITLAGSSAPLYNDQPEEPETNATDSIELFEDNQVTSRSKAIASKTKEIEQVYRQDCETFGMVVKMLIDKDPSLEKSVQFALRQNLHEIGERCIEELKHFITEYDAANQEFGESF
ncbi:periphilin-1 [Gracilinanus agilis]|uniref:periphilin-1 n=1 Tax=Gracilinanus agilis TaxID=191870 RepID=UPI001CFDB997|nr:periphilin-1 [Gracilinanus agilis]